MSFTSWKKQYYPVPAEKVKNKIAAIRHSLRKWKGLTAHNLTKHGLLLSDGCTRIYEDDDNYLYIDCDSCALCCLYIEKGCTSCPLYEHLKKRCDSSNGPYFTFDDDHDPQPMIKALTAVLKKATKKRKKR